MRLIRSWLCFVVELLNMLIPAVTCIVTAINSLTSLLSLKNSACCRENAKLKLLSFSFDCYFTLTHIYIYTN